MTLTGMSYAETDMTLPKPVHIQGPLLGQAHVCEPILRSLPDWFGIESAIQRYRVEIDALPTFLAAADDGVAGFLTLKQHTDSAAEIYVMGLYPALHRRGVGRALVDRATETLSRAGVEYLQVKTLGPARSAEYYAATRAFYTALGFRPLEDIKQRCKVVHTVKGLIGGPTSRCSGQRLRC